MNFKTNGTDRLRLEDLEAGMPGITPRFGSALAEAAVVCLEEQHHTPGVEMRVDGDCDHQLAVGWDPDGDRAQRWRCWGDPEEATEHAAYGIAALLVSSLTEYTVVQRARKGPGFDYWLGPKNNTGLLFQGTARLEVSGTLPTEPRGSRCRRSDATGRGFWPRT